MRIPGARMRVPQKRKGWETPDANTEQETQPGQLKAGAGATGGVRAAGGTESPCNRRQMWEGCAGFRRSKEAESVVLFQTTDVAGGDSKAGTKGEQGQVVAGTAGWGGAPGAQGDNHGRMGTEAGSHRARSKKCQEHRPAQRGRGQGAPWRRAGTQARGGGRKHAHGAVSSGAFSS